MNQKQAFAAAATLLGVSVTKVGIRVKEAALVGDDREQARDEARLAEEADKAASKALEARRAAILAGDAEYQGLRQARIDADKALILARARAFHRRVSILRIGEIFNEEVAEGDNFADAIDNLKKRRPR